MSDTSTTISVPLGPKTMEAVTERGGANWIRSLVEAELQVEADEEFNASRELFVRHWQAMKARSAEITAILFQNDREHGSLFTNLHLPPAKLARLQDLESWWRVASYDYLNVARSYIHAVAYYEIRDPSSRVGWRAMCAFQREFENFVVRLMACRDKISHLFNVYHGLQVDEEKVSFAQVLKQGARVSKRDRFRIAFFDELAGEVFGRLEDQRHRLSHRDGVDLIGVGYPKVSIEQGDGYMRLNILGRSSGWADIDVAKTDMDEAMQRVSRALTAIAPLISAAWPDTLPG